MNLHEYPQLIFEVAEQLNSTESEISRVRNAIARFEGLADSGSAFAPDLKNDAQRKARRFEILQTSDEYATLQNQLIELVELKSNLLAQLERSRNQFTAAKLEARAQIARQLAGSEFSEFIGI
jgi:uncharacterized membrane protein YccC